MNRRTLVFLAMACIGLALPWSASAQTGHEGKMRVLGRATIEAIPDYAVVSVGVSNKAKTPAAALDQNSAIARKIIDFAKKFGVDEKDIQTESVNLSPAFRQVKQPDGGFRQEPDGYTARNSVRVKVADLPRLGTFLRDALDQGPTHIGSLQFGLSTIEKLTDDARTKAVENAFHQAELLAKAAKVKLGPVHEIVHPVRIQAHLPERMAAAMPAQGRQAVPIATGTVAASAEVDITWTIQ
jgi:uncharacterized protein